MKLLVLANSRMFGGAEVFLWRFCRELCALGVPTVVVCPPGGRLSDRFRQLPLAAFYEEEMGMTAGRIRGFGSLALLSPRLGRSLQNLLARMLEQHGCDVVLCQYPREQVLAVPIAKELGYRTVWITHSLEPYLMQRFFLHPRLRRAMPQADTVFMVSQGTKNAFVALGYPETVMRVISAGTDIPSDLPPRGLHLHQRIGIVCRLVQSKGVQYTLRAAPKIIREFPHVQFLIAGEGRYRVKLERLAGDLGLHGSVRFQGFVTNPWQVYSQIDLLVHATLEDSMPLTILEAAACGVPTVATRVGGIPEIVQHERTGLLIPPRDSDAIASATLRLLRDRPLAVQLGQQAKEFVTRNFAMSRITHDMLRQLASEGVEAGAC